MEGSDVYSISHIEGQNFSFEHAPSNLEQLFLDTLDTKLFPFLKTHGMVEKFGKDPAFTCIVSAIAQLDSS